MVQLKELRIGNALIGNNKEYFNEEYQNKVDIIDENLLYRLIMEPANKGGVGSYDYVPLSVELLQKLGFEKNKTNNEYSIKIGACDWLFFKFIDDSLILTQDGEYSIGNPIYLLHQLQNLFFVLVQIELLDLVRYNYFKTKVLADNPTTFEEFIAMREIGNFGIVSPSSYKIGDLPENLFTTQP